MWNCRVSQHPWCHIHCGENRLRLDYTHFIRQCTTFEWNENIASMALLWISPQWNGLQFMDVKIRVSDGRDFIFYLRGGWMTERDCDKPDNNEIFEAMHQWSGWLKTEKTTIEKSKTWQLTATISINNKNEDYLCSVEAEIGSSAPMTQITEGRWMENYLFMHGYQKYLRIFVVLSLKTKLKASPSSSIFHLTFW